MAKEKKKGFEIFLKIEANGNIIIPQEIVRYYEIGILSLMDCEVRHADETVVICNHYGGRMTPFFVSKNKEFALFIANKLCRISLSKDNILSITKFKIDKREKKMLREKIFIGDVSDTQEICEYQEAIQVVVNKKENPQENFIK
jgi:hypothetical protein